jgi:hypothetical protein
LYIGRFLDLAGDQADFALLDRRLVNFGGCKETLRMAESTEQQQAQ